jgi:hypothetical protein
MKSMLANPNDWMKNEARQAAIRNFCNRFALTDRRWPSRSRQALRVIDEVKIDDATYIICVRCKIALHNSCEETYGHKYYTICPRCDRGGSLGTMYAPDKIK